MKIQVIAIGSTDSAYLNEGCKIFLERLKHYVKFEFQDISLPKKMNSLPAEERKIKEGELILKQLETGDVFVLLDEKGKDFTSRQFSEYLEKHMISGCKRLVLVIGGAFGFSEEVYAKATSKISLSKMTFSHQMIRLFLFEQIYRAFTILKNEPYHND